MQFKEEGSERSCLPLTGGGEEPPGLQCPVSLVWFHHFRDGAGQALLHQLSFRVEGVIDESKGHIMDHIHRLAIDKARGGDRTHVTPF